jgi:outer membrane receptor for ferrienterochelin and colicins
MGYKFTTIIIFFLCCHNLYSDDSGYDELMGMSIEELMDFEIVTATRTNTSIADIPASVVIITRQEIEAMGYRSISEIIQNIPGFYMIDDYNFYGYNSFGVRGFFNSGMFNNVIILVNGVSQKNEPGGDFQEILINVPPEAIERIEVVRGPMSVTYGSGAFFGAINIITNKSSMKSEEYAASLSYGNYGSKEFFGRVAGGSDEYSFDINIAFDNYEGLDVPFSKFTDNNEYLIDMMIDPNGTTKGHLYRESKYFGFSGRYKNFTANITTTGTHKGIYDAVPSVGKGSERQAHSSIFSVGYKNDFADWVSVFGSFDWIMNNFNLDYEILEENTYCIDYSNSDTYSANLDVFFKVMQNFNLTFGLNRRSLLHYKKTLDYPPFGESWENIEYMLDEGDVSATNAIYLKGDYTIKDFITIFSGIRFEEVSPYDLIVNYGMETSEELSYRYHYEGSGLQIIPSFALIINPLDQHIIKFLYSKAIREPSIYEVNTGADHNVKLEPSEIKTAELNYIFNYSDKLLISLSAFHNRLTKLIERSNEIDPETGDILISIGNTGEMITHGMEFGVIHSPIKSLLLNLNITYQNIQYVADELKDVTPGHAPQILGYLKLSYELPYNVILGLNSRYIGKMEASWDPAIENTDGSFGARVGNSVDDHYVIDLNLRWKNIFDTGIFLNLRASNLLDEEIRYPTTLMNTWAEKGTLGFGRSILLTAGWEM